MRLDGTLGVDALQVPTCVEQQAADTAGGVQDAHSGSGRAVDRTGGQQLQHERHDVGGRVVLARGLARTRRETAQELLEHLAHPVVVDDVRIQVEPGDLSQQGEQEPRFLQALHLGVESERVEQVARGDGQAREVIAQAAARDVAFCEQIAKPRVLTACRFEPEQHQERQDDAGVLVRTVVAAQ